MQYSNRLSNLTMMVRENLLIRHQWVGQDESGMRTACLLAALSPEVATFRNAAACPASVMPGWLAYLTPSMDDHVTDNYWPIMINEYAAVAAIWPVLDSFAWERIKNKTILFTLEKTLKELDYVNPQIKIVLNQVISIYKSIERGETAPTFIEWGVIVDVCLAFLADKLNGPQNLLVARMTLSALKAYMTDDQTLVWLVGKYGARSLDPTLQESSLIWDALSKFVLKEIRAESEVALEKLRELNLEVPA